MAVTSQVYFASDERWYVQYVSRIGEVERQWTEGPYRWRWLARLNQTRWHCVPHQIAS
ncbi:MAG: hypothetical protein WB036_15790 [Pseudolabrys sp.]|jgi:hypothetical protein